MKTDWHDLAPALVAEHLAATGPGAVAEIGVWRGELSARLLQLIPALTHLTLVDPWHPSMLRTEDNRWYYCGPGTTMETMEAAYQETRRVTDWYQDCVTILRLPSVEAANKLIDESLAVVLIDALHFKNTLMDDIAAWRSKLRPGGLMIGDDYSDYYPGVQLGVEAVFGNKHKVLGQTWWAYPNGGRYVAMH